MDECVKAGDVCLSALRCLKQGDGSYACGYDAKWFQDCWRTRCEDLCRQ